MSRRLIALATVIFVCGEFAFSQSSKAAEVDGYVRPYAQSQNFSGGVLVERDGKIILERYYGDADREGHVANDRGTRFHIASLSMQFTAAAALRLVEQGKISLDDPVSKFVEGIDGGDKVSVRDLLIQRSGLPDINGLPNYDDILQHHQTPESLIAAIKGKPLLFEPGSKFLHEEHSAYNLLALIIEKKTGLPFAKAMKNLLFAPLRMQDSGIDDDSADPRRMAKGYEPEETSGLKPAQAIRWSAKAGNANAFSTVADEARWVAAYLNGQVVGAKMRDQVFDTSMRVGYGWFKSENKRFQQQAYSMNGRSPGFASFLLHLPKERLTVICFSNIYSSATTAMGYDIAAIMLGEPYEPLKLRSELTRQEMDASTGAFQFGEDFYQQNAKLKLELWKGRELSLVWPSGDRTFLLPVDKDRFVDRAYWQDVTIERGADGKPTVLNYDRFHGKAETR